MLYLKVVFSYIVVKVGKLINTFKNTHVTKLDSGHWSVSILKFEVRAPIADLRWSPVVINLNQQYTKISKPVDIISDPYEHCHCWKRVPDCQHLQRIEVRPRTLFMRPSTLFSVSKKNVSLVWSLIKPFIHFEMLVCSTNN